ncbi:MAG TPA: glycosyltransferase family 39 protein [Pyrinomonadaceae bacterium]|nr:glycosyltransferase family 39 protein [Pyrinomonadaceae bacterium]
MLQQRLKGALLSFARDRSLHSALFAFALSRGLIFSLFILSAHLTVFQPDPQVEFYNGRISVRHVAFARIIDQTVSVADTVWYAGIARDGYERLPFADDRLHNWAFFPLYPLLIGYVSRLTGDIELTGVALSNAFFLVALVLLFRTARAFGFDDADARRTVFYVAAFPLSYFFSVPMTESLFLMLTVGSFYAAKRERWLLAGLLGAFASATRVTGVLLLPALAVLYWETYRSFRPRLNFLPLLLIPSGLLCFMYFLYKTTGNALAFRDNIAGAWGRRPQFFLKTLFGYLSEPLLIVEPWDFRLLNFLGAAGALAGGVVLLRWRQWSLAAYVFAASFIALSNVKLASQGRYSMVLFPAFIVLAVAGRNTHVDNALRTAMLILLTLMTILYARHFDFALA